MCVRVCLYVPVLVLDGCIILYQQSVSQARLIILSFVACMCSRVCLYVPVLVLDGCIILYQQPVKMRHLLSGDVNYFEFCCVYVCSYVPAAFCQATLITCDLIIREFLFFVYVCVCADVPVLVLYHLVSAACKGVLSSVEQLFTYVYVSSDAGSQ